jgi:hypothetical protein
MIFLLQAYVLSYSKRLALYSCTRDNSKEEHKQSMTSSLVTQVLLVLQMGGGLQRTS